MSNLDTRDAHPLWQFSLAVYAEAEVQAECLALQDARGVDVNLLLYCAWLGVCGVRLQPSDLDRARAAIAEWSREVIRPLRAARRAIKALHADPEPGVAALRASIGEAELAAERIAQDRLHVLGSALPRPENSLRAEAARVSVRCNIDLLLKDHGAPTPGFPEALAAAATAYAAPGTP